MPKATVTVRELKNKDTGVDLSVTNFKEVPGLMRSTFEYQIVVVSNLSCFKLPSHKETDVVQFTHFRKFNEFEELRTKLNEVYSGTAFPPIVKKSIIVNDTVIRERRNNLDTFLKFIAATPRIVADSHVLIFLGVDPQKARRFASGDADDSSAQEKDSNKKPDGEADGDTKETGMGRSASNLFEEEEEEVDDFLGAGDDDDNADFFGETSTTAATGAVMFESQDLKRELTEEDEKDFSFIPDAIVTKTEVVTGTTEEDNEDLLNVEEDVDLDQFLTMDISGKKEQPDQTEPNSAASKPETPQKPSLPTKPKPAPKPITDKPASKPAVPVKPKPRTSESDSKPPPPVRPKPAPRKLKPQTTGQSSDQSSKAEGEGKVAGKTVAAVVTEKKDLSTDDIMQYIAANVSSDDADVDLFS